MSRFRIKPEWVDVAEARARRAAEQARAAASDSLVERLILAGVGRKHAAVVGVGGAENSGPMAALRARTGPIGIAVLAGPTGIGKTTAAVAWLAADMRRNPGVARHRFITGHELQRASRYCSREMEGLERANRLVIDDVEVGFFDAKNALTSLIDGLINMRYQEGRDTLICSNLKAAAFRSRFGDRVCDRIQEGPLGFIEFPGASRRRS